MWRWIRELDRILRGEATRISAIQDGTIRIPVFGIGVLVALLGLFAGFCVGWFALFDRKPPAYEQLFASAIKVPLLFLLTLLVTFPSLYVFNALVGSRLSLGSVFRLLVAGMAVTMAVLASFGPITAFFSVSTENYSFMVLLNVALFAVAGVLGLVFLLRTLHRLTVVETIRSLPSAEPPGRAAAAPPSAPAQAGLPANGSRPSAESDVRAQTNVGAAGAPLAPLRPPMHDWFSNPPEPQGALENLEGQVLGTHVKSVFRAWVLVFGLVGAQMAWVLRPFIGDPHRPFAWFRARESNFFEAVWNTVLSLFH